uniref:Uncharacterized protein n=1 Tax=Coccidioides posadasii RMSCC 3488 TaxID=454284 RepID=A0A0J6FPU7_COCPO|nr:hypothetical protein CPAG_07306 [Coccidioides posadasii RMSCC 3488]
MKAHYRSAIAELSYLDNAAPVKKKCFIKAYSQACIKALEPEGKFDRAQRAFLQKTTKLIGELNSQQAAQLAVVHKLSSQAEAFWHSKIRKQVQLDPDSQFANIEKIGQAMEEAAALQARLQQCQPETEP